VSFSSLANYNLQKTILRKLITICRWLERATYFFKQCSEKEALKFDQVSLFYLLVFFKTFVGFEINH